ncbi:glycosyltransferase involved in cell wall biosynthesis [Arthrobacter sp. PvP023]|uniref:glycosyltransferase n=1 Tax=Micrococcaceae TaxID=1268 RepID=UPI001AE11715|nr:glycosyltransferase [Arthrobacter sp. PvP023]MBP1135100.1 glycosyltransferase involved in cell wall biosynthesis [Arthrobacter sp. PvP023]
MTKVVILQEYVPTYRIGFFSRLVDSASREGIEVVVAAGHPNSSQAKRGDSGTAPFVVPISQREMRLGGRRLVFRNTFQVAKGADLLVLEQARRNLDAYLLFLPRFLRKNSWALWGHGRDYVESRSRFSTWLQSAITRRSDWFFAYTSGGAGHVERLPYPAGQITTVMNAIDTAAMRGRIQRVDSRQIADFRQRFQINGRVVSFIGALDASKRIPFLLESIRLLNVTGSEVSFVIAGDGPLRHELMDLASDLPNVHFVGRADDEMKHLILSMTHLLVVPGRVGLIAVDSLAAGVPIVTTNWAFHAPEFEYLKDGVTSRIVNNDVEDYALAIEELLQDEVLRERLSRNSLSEGDGLGAEQMAQNFLEGILAALNRGANN